jgi:hypothetical protein
MQLNDTNRVISDQVQIKAKQRILDGDIFGHERNKVRERANEVQTVEQLHRSEQKQKQLLYRDMLGSQIEFTKQIKMQGNMTATEKKLNKGQLKAFKHGKHPKPLTKL